MRSLFSNSVTLWPARASCCAHAMPGRTRADHGDALAGLLRREIGMDPALFPAAVDDLAFDGFDRDRIVVDVERARRFARRRTDASGEFREIVGRVQRFERRLPLIAIDQIVPVRDHVVDRTALMAERNAAIHAARGLLATSAIGQRLDEFRARSSCARRPFRTAASWRSISMKPVGLPIVRCSNRTRYSAAA